MVTPNLLDKVEGTAATVFAIALSISLSFVRGVWKIIRLRVAIVR